MINYNNEICDKCTRISSCTHPCSSYQDYMFIHNLEKAYKEENVNDYKCKDEIEDILEWSVDQPEYLQIVNGLRKPSDIISWKDLLYIMTEKNIKYCSDNDLCEVCHSPLVDEKQVEEYCGCRMVVGVHGACPNNC